MGTINKELEADEKKYWKDPEETTFDIQKTITAKDVNAIPIPLQSNRYQEIKTKLTTYFPKESIKIIMITGTAHGNGSSFTAVSFATTLVRDFRLNVLLMDANLRYPRLHEIFHIENNQGVSNLLTQKDDKTIFVKKVGHGGLYLIPCGKKNSEPTNLFESVQFENALKIMRERFDYVILDAPPVNSYAESIVIATKVDGVILVLESDKTRQQVAVRAKQEMEKAGAKVLGLILNKRKHYIPEWIYKRL